MSLIYTSNLKDVIKILELGYIPSGKSLHFVEKDQKLSYNEGAVIWLKLDCIINKQFKFNDGVIKWVDIEKAISKKSDPTQLNEITTGKINNKFIRRIFIVSNDKKLVKKIVDITNDMELNLCIWPMS